MHRFYILPEAITGTEALITGQEARHLSKVLRLGPGDRVELADGQGTLFQAEITDVSPQSVHLALKKETSPERESPVRITIAQALIKEARMDDVIRPLTELGIDQWIPFTAERSVPIPSPGRIASRLERWERIAREAIKQCGRTCLPRIQAPVSFDEILAISRDYDQKIAFWEKSSRPIGTIKPVDNPSVPSRVIILIGPEGGFSEQEIARAETSGFEAFSLGPRILRAETAAVAATVLIQHLFGDLG